MQFDVTLSHGINPLLRKNDQQYCPACRRGNHGTKAASGICELQAACLLGTRPPWLGLLLGSRGGPLSCLPILAQGPTSIAIESTDIGRVGATGEPYWLVKNEWSAHWGDKGFIKINRKNDCAVASESFFVDVASSKQRG
jgi:hypothetical protein